MAAQHGPGDECSMFLELPQVDEPLSVSDASDADELDQGIEGVSSQVNDATVLAAIERNLGYVPTNLVRVAAMSGDEPSVLLLYPLRNCMQDYKKHHRKLAEPFPTIYWLASQELSERISILEASGVVSLLTDRLIANPAHVETMRRMHADYAAERYAMLTDADRRLVEQKQWTRALQVVGIAGMRNPASVKCLHAHYAHYLATRNNLVGEWVHAILQDQSQRE
ncbi:unnamed protein product [Aphanomyces euteiches]|uniref:DUF501 domain-containing protein n=1 Tax=Aphanomyces euteiches TaxID=100861 RepID=A0A6G0WVN6_9STRA|nr:hypothetical protein Ae201684_011171 [Aphanomyces euteiches]KAH9156986.1 hypothetical protein AeRB84_001145 [Aphanomyces euteiches]